MKYRHFLSLALILTVMSAALPAIAKVTLEERLQSHVKKLCEDPNGRAPGTEGHRQARLYITAQMKEIGLEPADFLKDYAGAQAPYEITTYFNTNLYRSLLGHLVSRVFPIARPGPSMK